MTTGVTRERLLHLLAEASELEHNLLCSYLFALFSLKRRADEQITADEHAAIQRWRRLMLGVCVEEMLHLTQVANITAALGAQPHFNRPNLPVAPGYHPAGIVIGLTPFSVETLKHFVFLERPDCVALQDSGVLEGCEPPAARRAGRSTRLTPSAPEYKTVGEFYGIVRRSLQSFVEEKGDSAFFDDGFQLDGALIDAPSLVVVRRLDDAVMAIDRIVEQGEGGSDPHDASHFSRFTTMLEQLNRLQAARPGFEPARRVGPNPVLRAPQAEDRTALTAPRAVACADAFNAVYWMMLRALAAIYAGGSGADVQPLVRLMLDCMHLLADLADPLTESPADEHLPGVMAGPSFTIFRHSEGATTASAARRQLAERCIEIKASVVSLPIEATLSQRLDRKLADMAACLAGTRR